MKTPGIAQNETTRLKVLRSLRILDTPAEERFDRLTRLAKRIFGVPIALISLVDENRQWFKSCVGLSTNETSREISFCGHTILGDEVLIIENATRDIRFADNPLVMGAPYIRFYAGCPLRYLDGSRLGTLCIIDTSPRTISDQDIETLMDLSELAERELASIELTVLDDLTRLSNKRGFLTIAQKCLEICNRKDIPASLVYLVMTELRSINASHGHIEGNRSLTTFADLMRHTFRDSDVIARLGGNEFVALITDTSTDRVENTIARLRQSLKTYNKKSYRGYSISFTERVIAIDHTQALSIESLLNRASTVMH